MSERPLYGPGMLAGVAVDVGGGAAQLGYPQGGLRRFHPPQMVGGLFISSFYQKHVHLNDFQYK